MIERRWTDAELLWTEEDVERQKNMDRLEELEKCIERIENDLKAIMNQPIETIDRKDLEGIIEEIEWEVRCLN